MQIIGGKRHFEVSNFDFWFKAIKLAVHILNNRINNIHFHRKIQFNLYVEEKNKNSFTQESISIIPIMETKTAVYVGSELNITKRYSNNEELRVTAELFNLMKDLIFRHLHLGKKRLYKIVDEQKDAACVLFEN